MLETSKSVYRELALIKMKAEKPTARMEITTYASIFRANILDIDKDTIMVEITGTPDKIDASRTLSIPLESFNLQEPGYLLSQEARTFE